MTKINQESVSILPAVTSSQLPILERLPQHTQWSLLDGSAGSNRALKEQPHINAQNDYEAVYCWLNEYRHKQTTYTLYQKEAERLLLWSVFQRHKALSSLVRDDFELYIAFLDNPQPAELWCASAGGRGRKRGSASWKPFTGPLSLSSKRTALSAIDSLFNYLIQARYLNFNPLSLMRKKLHAFSHNSEIRKFNIQERVLEPEVWQMMVETLEQLPEKDNYAKNEKERLRFLVYILYFLGLRISELATHTFAAFRQSNNEWWFYVIGKGDKPGRIPVNDELLQATKRYREHFQLASLPEPEESTPLIFSWRSKEGLTPRHMNKLLKKLAIETAKQFETQPMVQTKLKNFSAHWLRHQSATMQDLAGIAAKHIQANHRHESDQTTRLYVHALDKERHQDMQKLRINLKK